MPNPSTTRNQRLAAALQARFLGKGTAGLTLIESLVAIVVISLAVSSIAPALVIATATRVRAQRGEQALALAQQEIDTVRAIVERGNYNADDLPSSTTTISSESTPASMVGPDYGTPESAATVYQDLDPTETREVDIDGDGVPDFAVQVYRTPGLPPGDTPVAFGMGVRVYNYEATEAQPSGTMPSTPTQLGTTAGISQQGQRPLAALYTTIVRSEDASSFCDYIRFTSTSASTPNGC